MKKSLLAVAAMTAFAGAAQAQSSVTVYGILDVGFRGETSRDGATKTNQTQLNGLGNESTSRLGFKGVEDLGGGMNAFFTAEMQIDPATSTSYTAMTNRQTFAGIGKKGLGSVAIGTQYTPIHLAVGATDPGQQNNMPGSVIYTTNAAQGNGETATSYTIRSNNSLTLKSDSFAGFRVNGFYANNNSDTNQVTNPTTGAITGGTSNNGMWGISADYTWKKLYVTAAYQAVKNESSASATAVSTANVTDGQQYAAVTYDFGILKAYAQYVNRKLTSNIDSNAFLKRSAQQIGVRSFITPKIEAWASGGTGRFSSFGPNQPTANFTAYQLGSNYYLSKRTNLYAIWGSTQTSSVTDNAAAGRNGYAIGVRHTF